MEGSLQGKLLIASPLLTDPNFHRSVVLVAEHSEHGAMGLVLNRPLGVPVEDAVPSLVDLVAPGDAVHEGGPVQPDAVMALGEFHDTSISPALAFGTIGFLPAPDGNAVAEDAVVRVRVFAGYDGWAAEQLEAEMADQAWFAVAAEPEDCFTDDADGLWQRSLRRLGGTAAMFSLLPDDPSRN